MKCQKRQKMFLMMRPSKNLFYCLLDLVGQAHVWNKISPYEYVVVFVSIKTSRTLLSNDL